MDPRPENLYQYAIMGNLYSQSVFGLPAPRIGLLNVGVEPEKGNELAKQTYKLLKNSSLNFVGNVEARDVMQGECDVLICDGFVGNVLLKSMEGVAQAIFAQMKDAIMTGGVKAKIGALLLKSALGGLKKQMDYSEHGGSPLLGINGVCVKCHGSCRRQHRQECHSQAGLPAGQESDHCFDSKINGGIIFWLRLRLLPTALPT